MGQRSEAMKTPVHITINFQCSTPLIYVYYVDPDEVREPQSEPVGFSLVIDTNKRGELVGIELLDMEPATIDAARKAAADHSAVFPPWLNFAA